MPDELVAAAAFDMPDLLDDDVAHVGDLAA
jgi:hypothetical protein